MRLLGDIKNLDDFSKFMRLLAILSGQEINYAELGRDLGIANSTAIMWKSIVKNSYVWHELEPYYNNILKRLSKKPKGFLFDTGVMCYLAMIDSAVTLAKHPRAGAVFETFVVNTILYYLKARFPYALSYHWRTAYGQAVDLIIECNGQLYPIEIKLKTKIDAQDLKSLKAFMNMYKQASVGIVVYAGSLCRYVQDNIIVVPWNGVA